MILESYLVLFLFIRKDFTSITDEMVELLVSCLFVGSLLGSTLFFFSNIQFGRRLTIIFSNIFFVVGSLTMAFTPMPQLWWLVMGRFILGIGIGGAIMTVPMYLSEISPPKERGKLVSLYEIFIVSGIFISFLTNFLISKSNIINPWRYSFGFAAVPAIVQMTAMIFLPESPRWLILKERNQEAKNVMINTSTLTHDEIDSEINKISESISDFDISKTFTMFKLLFSSPAQRKALIISLGLAIFTQITGHPTVLYYSAQVIHDIGGFANEPLLASLLPVAVKLVTVIIFSFLIIDQIGRRSPLLVGIVINGISLFAIGIAYQFTDKTVVGWIVVIALSFYCLGFSISFGPLLWVIPAEIFNNDVRTVGLLLQTATNTLFNAIMSATFLSISKSLGIHITFWIYATICIFAFIFFFVLLPETKGKSLEDINRIVRGERISYDETNLITEKDKIN